MAMNINIYMDLRILTHDIFTLRLDSWQLLNANICFLKERGRPRITIWDINIMNTYKYMQILISSKFCVIEDCMKWLSAYAQKSCLVHVVLATLQSSITLPQRTNVIGIKTFCIEYISIRNELYFHVKLD